MSMLVLEAKASASVTRWQFSLPDLRNVMYMRIFYKALKNQQSWRRAGSSGKLALILQVLWRQAIQRFVYQKCQVPA